MRDVPASSVPAEKGDRWNLAKMGGKEGCNKDISGVLLHDKTLDRAVKTGKSTSSERLLLSTAKHPTGGRNPEKIAPN